MDAAALEALIDLASADDPLGARAARSRARRALGAQAEAMAPLLDAMVRRASEVAHLRQLCGTDALTGVANRRAFEAAIGGALERQRGGGRGVSVVLLDLDGLKALNDTLGHAAGDEALREASDACRAAVRRGDLVARLGGDELAVLLRDTTEAEAGRVAARIRAAVEARRVQGRGLRTSVGWAEAAAPDEPAAALLARADARLYADKQRRKTERRRAAA
jgi:diguanylate cyclase (GGDEF)-like protein